jgi:hypothetical protein
MPNTGLVSWSYIAGPDRAACLSDVIGSMYKEWRPFTDKEIRLRICGKSTRDVVNVSGSMSHVYHDKVSINHRQVSYCSSVSLSCTTLRIQIIKYHEDGRCIQDVNCNNDLIQCLLPKQESSEFPISHSANYVSIKIKETGASKGKGVRLTLGKNGGLQYLGGPTQIAALYNKFCSVIFNSMSTCEFKRHLSRSHGMTTYGFPSGINRSTTSKDA